jgi:hypothetical protein
MSDSTQNPEQTSTRRDFLHQAAGLAAGAAAVNAAEAAGPAAAGLLLTVKLGPHSVTRLILGGLIVGMYQEFGDQVGENAALARATCVREREG